MAGRKIKCSLTQDGRLFMVDPSFDCLPVITRLQPDFSIQSIPPPLDFVPSFQRARRVSVQATDPETIQDFDASKLWDLHDGAIREGGEGPDDGRGLSLFDLKIELARRELERCGLCGRNCGANRFEGKGRCGLGPDAHYDEPFVHIAEEAVITPSATVRLVGCALNCVFCQARESYAPKPIRRLDSGLWAVLASDIYFSRAASLEFGGGNPDESACAILEALNAAPLSFRLPVVMNDNGYASPVLYKLLDGVVDVWLTDFKYGNSSCARRLSGAGNYVEVAEEGMRQICSQEAKAIVRMLILPGHVECCHKPGLEKLSAYREKIWLSVIDNFVPDWKTKTDPGLNRLVSPSEIEEAREAARRFGIRAIEDAGGGFWR